MNTTDQEALDYFYERIGCYYDEDEQDICGLDIGRFLLLTNFFGGQFYDTTYSFYLEYQSTFRTLQTNS